MKTLGIIVVILVLAGLGWYFYSTQYQAPATPTPPTPAPAFVPPSASGLAETMVEMTSSGFSPAETTIKAGDTVRFVNKDTKNHWPASGVHPTHQLCPGFDALGAVKPGESYSFRFAEKKECPFHDHLSPATRGKIIVQ